jgi:hypothetical protein
VIYHKWSMTLWTTSWFWNDSPCIDPAVMDHWWTWVWPIMCLINFYHNLSSTSRLYCSLASVDYAVVNHQLILRWSTMDWLCCCGPLVDLGRIDHVSLNFYHNLRSTSRLCCSPASVDYGVVDYQLILRWSTMHQLWWHGLLVDLGIIYLGSHQLLP